MISRNGIIWTVLALVTAIAAFTVKYKVKDLEDQLASMHSQIHDHEEAIHVLTAEWSYLNRPERLAALAQRYLDLTPMDPKQMASLDDVPSARMPAAGTKQDDQSGSTLVNFKVGQQ